jgi:hypothetical protein
MGFVQGSGSMYVPQYSPQGTFNPANAYQTQVPSGFGGSGISGGSYGGGGGMSPMSMNDSAFTPHVISMTPTGGGGGGGMGGGGSFGAMGGVGGGGMLNQLMSSFQTAGQQQTADSLAQYKALLASVAGTRKSVEGQFNSLGQSGLNQIGMDQQNQLGKLNQNLVGRGLGNTTIANTMAGGINRNAMNERTNLQSAIAGQKIGAQMNLGQMQGDAILSRQNVGPDMSTYLQLISQLAAGSR